MYKKLDRSGELEYAGDRSTGDSFSPYKRGVILIRFHTRESIISLQHQIPHRLLIRIFYFVGRQKKNTKNVFSLQFLITLVRPGYDHLNGRLVACAEQSLCG